MSQKSVKKYKCTVCGDENQENFYVSKSHKKCKSCILKENRNRLLAAKNVLAVNPQYGIAAQPIISDIQAFPIANADIIASEKIANVDIVSRDEIDSMFSEVYERIESLNSQEMEEFPLEIPITWRDNIERKISSAGDMCLKSRVVEVRLDLANKKISEIEGLFHEAINDIIELKKKCEIKEKKEEEFRSEIEILKEENKKLNIRLDNANKWSCQATERMMVDNLDFIKHHIGISNKTKESKK
jgi:hypothetical protein